jgi:ferritin-like metal-binding protein YciE
MFSWSNNNTNKTNFIEYLNEVLSLENAVVERLHRRIQDTPVKNPENLLQQQFQEGKEQQSRLRKLIVDCGGKPTSSKVDLLSLNSLTNATMDAIKKKKNNVLNDKITNSKSNDENDNGNNNIKNNNALMTPQETEILNRKEDALIKKAEISAYKKALKIAKKINDKDSTVVLKQSLQEKEFAYDKIKTSEDRMLNDIRSNNNNNNNNNSAHHEYFNLGSAVADMLTSYWNSKENPSKVYIFNRRIHHGAIGALLGFSGLYKNNSLVTGILSGLGAGLQKDDYNDFKEWFLFKKRVDDTKESK